MAHSPAVLETAYAAIQDALKDTATFDAKTREASNCGPNPAPQVRM